MEKINRLLKSMKGKVKEIKEKTKKASEIIDPIKLLEYCNKMNAIYGRMKLKFINYKESSSQVIAVDSNAI